jgi:magnesium-transporting ATPase (P-type)
LVAATLTLIIGLSSEDEYKWVEGASIYFAVVLIALFTAGADYAKNKQFLKLHDEIKNEETSVIRGQYGLSQPAKVFDIVVGDVILIEAGMRIPADCVLIEGNDITVDEAYYHDGVETVIKKNIATTENHLVNPDPFLLTKSLVQTGSGKAVVCAVGSHTQIGKFLDEESLEEEQALTPLQERLEKLAALFGKWAYAAGIIVFLSMSIFLVSNILFSNSQLLSNDTLVRLIEQFTIAVTIVIVAVPEGLPLAVSIAMAFSIDIMKRDQLLVKNLEACETMGTVTEICTGKTATLTANDMSVNTFYLAQELHRNTSKTTFTQSGINQRVVDIVKDLIILNCDARVEMSEDAKYEAQGNGTEAGMLKFL